MKSFLCCCLSLFSGGYVSFRECILVVSRYFSVHVSFFKKGGKSDDDFFFLFEKKSEIAGGIFVRRVYPRKKWIHDPCGHVVSSSFSDGLNFLSTNQEIEDSQTFFNRKR